MLSAIERGRIPAIDFLNGEIATRAEQHSIDVPVNSRIVELVHAIARREQASSRELLDRLYEQTR